MQELAELLQNVPGIHAIDLKDVKRLAQLLRETPEIGSIEVKGWFGTGVVITRTTAAPVAPSMPVIMPAPAQAPPPVTDHEARDGASRAASAATHLKEIRSPMVGTFYKAPEPGAEAYIRVGNRVSPGQTVCIIEAMKIMNEIQAESKGTITEVLVENGQPVEYGQRLFKLRQG